MYFLYIKIDTEIEYNNAKKMLENYKQEKSFVEIEKDI